MFTLRGPRSLALMLFCATAISFSALGQGPQAPVAAAPLPVPTAPSNNTYPQIVRIRYLEGDVRIARGEAVEKETGAEWEQAEADLPLETGFHLVTGIGRAEIEFEDASTMYLGDNSALAFDDLHTTAGVPYTQVTLLTGTLTLRIHPNLPGEVYLVKTPTDSLTTASPEKVYVRINSFLDAIAVTPLKDETLQITGTATQAATKGQTVFYSDGKPVAPEGPSDPQTFAEWDGWVATRVALRSAAMVSVAAASGLSASVPGMADMYGQGTFFKCAPYGTCWEPPKEDVAATPVEPPVPQQAAAPIVRPGFSLTLSKTSASIFPGGKAATKLSLISLTGFSGTADVTTSLPPGFTCVTACTGPLAPGQALAMHFAADSSVPLGAYDIAFTANANGLSHQGFFTIYVVDASEPVDFAMPYIPVADAAPYFPCFPGGLHPLSGIDGSGRIIGFHSRPYSWAVCHTGTWIFRNHVYLWVPSKRRHHHPPTHWIKCKKIQGYVPLHPRDVKGKPPVNRKHDIYAPKGKNGVNIERTHFDPKDKIEEMKDPPKEFRKPYVPVLARAEVPKIEAHDMRDGFRATGGGVTLAFDKKSHSFLVNRDVIDGGKHKNVVETFHDHNESLRARRGEVVPGGAHDFGRAGGGSSHFGAGGSTHIGGGTHTGGTHAGGGGHTGGGGHAGGGGHTGGGGHSGGGGHGGGGHH